MTLFGVIAHHKEEILCKQHDHSVITVIAFMIPQTPLQDLKKTRVIIQYLSKQIETASRFKIQAK
jgi:hypothetical protein